MLIDSFLPTLPPTSYEESAEFLDHFTDDQQFYDIRKLRKLGESFTFQNSNDSTSTTATNKNNETKKPAEFSDFLQGKYGIISVIVSYFDFLTTISVAVAIILHYSAIWILEVSILFVISRVALFWRFLVALQTFLNNNTKYKLYSNNCYKKSPILLRIIFCFFYGFGMFIFCLFGFFFGSLISLYIFKDKNGYIQLLLFQFLSETAMQSIWCIICIIVYYHYNITTAVWPIAVLIISLVAELINLLYHCYLKFSVSLYEFGNRYVSYFVFFCVATDFIGIYVVAFWLVAPAEAQTTINEMTKFGIFFFTFFFSLCFSVFFFDILAQKHHFFV